MSTIESHFVTSPEMAKTRACHSDEDVSGTPENWGMLNDTTLIIK